MEDALLAELSGPERLAILHAPVAMRGCLTSVLVLDRRLSAILHKTSEPVIAQLRFAWWRDRLTDDARKWPKGEPYFAALLKLKGQLHSKGLAGRLTQLVDLWEELAVLGEWNHDAMADFHGARARIIFSVLSDEACSAAADTVQQVGHDWSCLELLCQFPERTNGDPEELNRLMRNSQRLPRQLRPLAIMHRSAILELQRRQGQGRSAVYSSLRLFLCALTGR
jgi:15-cis-phytoene synthase